MRRPPWIRLGLLLLLILVGILASIHGGKSTSSGATPTAPPKPSPTAAVSGAGATLVAQMEAVMAAPRPLHVHFQGSDLGGSLQFDAVLDGNGNLSGTYVRQGASGDVVVLKHSLYMRGTDVIARFLNQPEDPQLNGWVRLPASVDPGILTTVATASQLSQCLKDSTAADVVVSRHLDIDGVRATEFAPPTNPDGSGVQPWQLEIAATGTPYLLSWQVVFANGSEPNSCRDGEPPLLAGQRAGITGVFNFSDFGAPVAPITVPPTPTDYPSQ